MDFWSWSALIVFLFSTVIVFWGLLSPTHCLPLWAHKNDKLWHFIAFSGLAILLQGAWTEGPPFGIWLILSCAGLLTEWMQEKWAPGRLFSWGDALSNAAGAGLGIAIAIPTWKIARSYI